MTTTIEILTEDHLKRLQMRPVEVMELQSDPSYQTKFKDLIKAGPAGAIVHKGVVIAAIGYVQWWPGVVEVWAFPSAYVADYAMIYLRTVKRYIQCIEASLPVNRIFSAAKDDPTHTRWMQFLGFKNETPDGMRNYFPSGGAANLWAKTYEVKQCLE